MSTTRSKIEPVASSVLAIAKHLQALIEQGLDRDAVLERLMDPASVGAAMIDRAVERRAEGAAYLGRGDDFVMLDPARFGG